MTVESLRKYEGQFSLLLLLMMMNHGHKHANLFFRFYSYKSKNMSLKKIEQKLKNIICLTSFLVRINHIMSTQNYSCGLQSFLQFNSKIFPYSEERVTIKIKKKNNSNLSRNIKKFVSIIISKSLFQ